MRSFNLKHFGLAALLVLLVSCGDNKPEVKPPPVNPPVTPEVPSDDAPMSVRAKFMFDCYSDAFFVSQGTRQFYRETLMATEPAYFWKQALIIMVNEDIYEITGDITLKTRINYLINTFFETNGNWESWNGYNDDLAWAALSFVRGYKHIPNDVFLERAKLNYKTIYDRGWDNELGGGIWWSTDREHKAGLSNNPVVSIACYLYEFTRETKYLTQAKEIYAWIRNTLFDNKTGAVYETIRANGQLVTENADNVYNSGAFIEAATLLYRLTKEQKYYDDAVMAIDYIIANKTVNGIMSRQIHDGGWQSEFCRGIYIFVTDHDLWDKYYDWMKLNAEAAWKTRRKDLHLTWNEWTKETANMDLSSIECNSAVLMLYIVPDEKPE